MNDHHETIYGCSICSTSKYLQVSLNAWCSSQLQILKVKSISSIGCNNDAAMAKYNVYADLIFPLNEPRRPHFTYAAAYLICLSLSYILLPKWSWVLHECTPCQK